jgi:hypothetical protein
MVLFKDQGFSRLNHAGAVSYFVLGLVGDELLSSCQSSAIAPPLNPM